MPIEDDRENKDTRAFVLSYLVKQRPRFPSAEWGRNASCTSFQPAVKWWSLRDTGKNRWICLSGWTNPPLPPELLFSVQSEELYSSLNKSDLYTLCDTPPPSSKLRLNHHLSSRQTYQLARPIHQRSTHLQMSFGLSDGCETFLGVMGFFFYSSRTET